MLPILFLITLLTSAVLLFWGWFRFFQQPVLRTAPSILSLIGFVLATASGLLALSTIAWAQFHHFLYQDPLLLRIFQLGAILSVGGVLFGVTGLSRRSSLRWHAPASALLMLAFWTVAVSGE